MLTGCDNHIEAPKITFCLEQNGILKIKAYIIWPYLKKFIAANKKTSAVYIALA
jgi:hypothetical protein